MSRQRRPVTYPVERRSGAVRRVATILAVVTAAGLAALGAATSTADGARGTRPAVRLDPPPARATFAFTGDILTHRPVNRAAARADGSYDYHPMFERIAPLLTWADIAICHLEQPVAPPGTPVIVGPAIHSSAASLAPALRSAGYDRCSTASNHSLDRGVAGIDATIEALRSAGLGHSGTARTAAEAVPEVFDVNGIAVAHLSYSYAVGGVRPAGEPWRANVIDPPAIVDAARDARARGADAVIVSLHWGSSARQAPSADQRRIAGAITAPGEIDLVVGHHAHVLQPIEKVDGTWVVWGLGNFVSNMPGVPGSFWPPSTQDGAVVTVELTRAADGRVTVERPIVYPTWCDKDAGYVVRPTSDADVPSTPLAVRSELLVSEARTRDVLGSFFGPS